MAQIDAIRKYLEAGMAFTQTTRAKAEEVVSNLVRTGELQTEQTQQQVQELVDRSRESTDRVVKAVRSEVMAQLSTLGLATKADLAKLERKVDAMKRGSTSAAAKGEEGTGQEGREGSGEEGEQEGGGEEGVTAPRRRLDAELVRRGLAVSREAAQRVIEAGLVTVGGAPADKASRMVGVGEPVEVLASRSRFVSRGGDKLAGALRTIRRGCERTSRARRGRVDGRLHGLLAAGGRGSCGRGRRGTWPARRSPA